MHAQFQTQYLTYIAAVGVSGCSPQLAGIGVWLRGSAHLDTLLVLVSSAVQMPVSYLYSLLDRDGPKGTGSAAPSCASQGEWLNNVYCIASNKVSYEGWSQVLPEINHGTSEWTNH